MLLKIFNITLLVAMIIVNYLANSLPINNQTTGEISAKYENLFTPAGLTFSIWGIIYLLLIVFVFLQFKESNSDIIHSISWLFGISSLLNILWIFAWHYNNLHFSVLIMLLLLVSLVLINIQIKDFPNSLIKASFGIYLGWILIAAVANITVWFVSMNWDGFGISPVNWAIIMIIAGLIISALNTIELKNPFILLSVIWAFIGIAIKQNNNEQSIYFTAIISALILFAMLSFLIYKTAKI